MMMNSRSDLELEKYSFSKLSTFEQCPYQYYLNYIMHESGEGNAMSEYGSFCHSLLERHFKGELESYELADEYENRYGIEIKHDFPEMFNVDLAEKYYNDGYNFFYEFEDKDWTILGVEQEFDLLCEHEENPFILRGFIDLIYKENGKLVFHDWKSKSKFKSKKELADYGRQLYLYSRYAEESGWGFPDILRFYCFRDQKEYDIPFKKEDYDAAWDWVYKTVEKIRETEMFLQDRSSDFMCNELCDFRYKCEENEIGFC